MTDTSYIVKDATGQWHDQRIEALLSLTMQGAYDSYEYESALHDIVREFLNPNAPVFLTRHLTAPDAMVLTYIVGLGYDFIAVQRNSKIWPGTFDYMPGAEVAVSICYRDNPQDGCGYAPGYNLNQAGLMALLQLAREHSEELCNQKRLI